MSSESSDIFTIGLIALEMCTLDSVTSIYDFEKMRIHTTELNRLISKAKPHYSPDFMDLLERMLAI